MAELLKNVYSVESIQRLGGDIQTVYPQFEKQEFLQAVLDDAWESRELKARMRHISVNMGKYLPTDYQKALSILDQLVSNYTGFWGMIFPDFVEVYGQDDENLALSIAAIAKYTVHSSSEFAVRPFIARHPERMMQQLYRWSKDENEHIRRLASEGCRPQLPWGQVLTQFKKDPTPILPILEQLKCDPSLYVRKSVANNLNDIAKTHPNLVIEIAKEWYGHHENTNWIVKHGCRTLLKKGNREALAIFGYEKDALDVEDFKASASAITIGEELTFSFVVRAKKSCKVRLEYGVEYVKASGKRNRKIFQIAETTLNKDEQKQYQKKHAFADLSTRKHYPGQHSIILIANGVEQGKVDFDLYSRA